ncbi:MAG: type II secretion system F family protein [Candidatus Doudnabacteria bacterium]
MPDFTYTARTKTGEIQSETLTGYNERAVAETLRGMGLRPISISEASRKFDPMTYVNFFRRIKLIDRITFIKNLGVMIKAGLPISRALKILGDQTTNPRFAKIVLEIGHLVEGGTSFADAMAKFPNIFSPIFVSMIHAGEVSGNLDQNLDYLADQMQRDYELMSKTRGAMIYPIIVIVALGIVGFLMFTFVLPKLTSTFTDLKVPLPAATLVLIFLVNIFSHYGILVLLFIIGLAGGFMYWRTTMQGKKILHKVILYTPVVGKISKKINQARFVRVFASLIKSGMSMVEALEISSHVVANLYYQQTIADAASKVKIGSPLTTAFKKQPKLFSNLVIQMMEVGEESGTTDTVLAEVADFYEDELDQTMKNLSSIMEPLIMMVIGVVVGYMAVALIAPIYNISSAI